MPSLCHGNLRVPTQCHPPKNFFVRDYIYISSGGGVALAPFLPAQAEQTALVASLQKELAHVKEDGLMGGDDRGISLFRETNLLSTRKRFKAKKNHRKKSKHLVLPMDSWHIWIQITQAKHIVAYQKKLYALVLGVLYHVWSVYLPIVFKYVFSVFLSPCFSPLFVFILLFVGVILKFIALVKVRMISYLPMPFQNIPNFAKHWYIDAFHSQRMYVMDCYAYLLILLMFQKSI